MIVKSKIDELCFLIKELGDQVELIKNSNFHTSFKSDQSPLTEADSFVNKELSSFFKRNNYPCVISEEVKNESYSARKAWKDFWIIDPIDGTKEFVKKNNDYTINVAFFSDNKLSLGIVYSPGLRDMYTAVRGNGAFKNDTRINTRINSTKTLKVVASKSHSNVETNDFIERLKENNNVELVTIGSSLKICLVAEGSADIYPRYGPTMEWDTAAADLVLLEAGGQILNISTKSQLAYNKPDLLNPHFVALSEKKYLNYL